MKEKEYNDSYENEASFANASFSCVIEFVKTFLLPLAARKVFFVLSSVVAILQITITLSFHSQSQPFSYGDEERTKVVLFYPSWKKSQKMPKNG